MNYIPTKMYFAYLAMCNKSYIEQGENDDRIFRDEAKEEEFSNKALAYAENCPLEDLTLTSVEGLTVLHYLTIANQYDAVEILLKRGADPNVRGVATGKGDYSEVHHGVTPLHLACDHALVKMVKLLLDNGADCSLSDEKGNNAYHFLTEKIDVKYEYDFSNENFFRERREIFNMLAGDINKTNADGKTPIQLLMRHRSAMSNMGDYLAGAYMDKGADITVRDENGNTLLMLAVKYNYANAVYMLARDKSILNLQNNDGDTALHFTIKEYDEALVELYEERVKDKMDSINISTSISDTELAMAYALIKAGAVFTIANNENVTVKDVITNPKARYGDVLAKAVADKAFVNMLKTILAGKKDIKTLWDLFDNLSSYWEEDGDKLYFIKRDIACDILRLIDKDDDTEMKYVVHILDKFYKPDKTPLITLFSDAGFDLNERIFMDERATTLAIEFVREACLYPGIIPVLKENGIDIDAVQPTGGTIAYHIVDGASSVTRWFDKKDRQKAYEGIIEALSYVSTESLTMADDKCESAAYRVIGSYSKSSGITDYILGRGIDINVCTSDNYTLLMAAIMGKDLEAARRLFEMGADETVENDDGKRAIHYMGKLLGEDGFAELLGMFKDTAVEERDGKANLLSSIITQSPDAEVVKKLIHDGADVNIRNNSKRTPLMELVYKRDDPELPQLLIDNGADIDAVDRRQETALMIAAERGYIRCVKCLIDNGADCTVEGEREETALDIAMKRGHSDIAALITEAIAKEHSKPKKRHIF